jgi:hypothetical protein
VASGPFRPSATPTKTRWPSFDRLDIRFADVGARLERVGVQQFAEASNKSINAIKKNARL